MTSARSVFVLLGVLFASSYACGLGKFEGYSGGAQAGSQNSSGAPNAAGAANADAGSPSGFGGTSAGASVGGSEATAGAAGATTNVGGASAGTAGSASGAAGTGGAITPAVPAIFYVPHADDDYLAMALGIAEHLDAHRAVKVVLYTNGGNSALRDIMNGMDAVGNPVTCPLYGSSDPEFENHERVHNFKLTDRDIKDIRTKEFERAMLALGVTDIVETDWEDSAVSGKADDPFTTKLKTLILQYEQQRPGSSHKCVSGIQDCPGGGGQPHPAHIACWHAANQLRADYPQGINNVGFWDFAFYDDYIYFNADPKAWHAQTNFDLSKYMPKKRAAFAAYHNYDPEQGEYALGYHSVPMLFDRAATDAFVHIERFETTPVEFVACAP